MWRRLARAWQRQREARAVARRPIADDLWKRTLVRYPFLRRRDPAQAAELRRMTSLFLDRKEFSAAGGLTLRNDMVVAIAAQACLPVLQLGLQRYDDFVGIVVHPGAVLARRASTDEAGVVHEYDEPLAGEAMKGGPVMLSWDDVRRAGASASGGYNVVIHEFAHVLDLANGHADGLPQLPSGLPVHAWMQALTSAHRALVAQVEADAPSALDPYGAQSIDEFFAVASEAFFVAPAGMKVEHPDLYGVFVHFYGQDPLLDQP